MTYPYLRGIGSLQNGQSGLSVAWPASHEPGDIGLLLIETSGSDSVITPPSGWSSVTGSPLTDVPTSSGSRFYLWWRRATSAAESNAVVADSGDHQIAVMIIIRNCLASGSPWTDVDTVLQSTASTSLAIPSVTSSAPNGLVFIAVSRPNDSTSGYFTSASNANLYQLTKIYSEGATVGNGGGVGVFIGGLPSPGESGTTSIAKLNSTSTGFVLLLPSGGPGLSVGYDFPSLAPATRRYSMGAFPVTTESGFGGGSIRFLHGSVSSGHTLELGYENLTATEASLIREHYRFRSGSHESFLLSTAAWAGHTSATDLVPTTTRWKYAAPPEETHKRGGLVDVAVSLMSVI